MEEYCGDLYDLLTVVVLANMAFMKYNFGSGYSRARLFPQYYQHLTIIEEQNNTQLRRKIHHPKLEPASHLSGKDRLRKGSDKTELK